MKNLQEQSVGQIVAEDYRTAHIFSEFNIDFCCGGDITLEEACREQDINKEELNDALKSLSAEEGTEDNYNNWPLEFLMDYIVNIYHSRTRELIPEIASYAETVASVHGGDHEELFEIYQEFTKVAEEMNSHMDQEEQEIFPYIKSLLAKSGGITDDDKANSTEMINMLEHEHDAAGESMKKIRKLSNSYALPHDACATYRVYYRNLEAFEKDLYKHVHLENNILFPKAIEIQNS
jgi:regulator of cell morphogenesis and NO signaling